MPSQRGKPGISVEARAEGKTDVFLSYNSKDHVLVEEIAAELQKLGLHPFLDRWDLALGLRWRPELEETLRRCAAVAVIVGPHGMGEVQTREVDVALRRQDKDRRFPVIPVLLPGAEPPSGFLEQLTWVDLRHQAVAEGVVDLAHAIRGTWGAEVSRGKSQANRRRYLANFLLLLAVLLVAALWYSRHLQTRLAHIAFGGSLTALALLRFVYDYVRWGAEEELKNLSRRILGSRHSSLCLGLALAFVLAAHAVTSSVHLERDLDCPADRAFAVEVRNDPGHLMWTSPSLTSDRTQAGHLFFFRFGAPAQLALSSEEDREPLSARLQPGGRLRVRVPSAFAPRDVHLLRLLPGSGLWNFLSKPGKPVLMRYDLYVSAAGRSNRLEDFRWQAVYLGSSDHDIELGLLRETAAAQSASFSQWAQDAFRIPGARTASVQPFVEAWQSHPRHIISAQLPELDSLRLDLVSNHGLTTQHLTTRVLDATNFIRTLLFDKSP